MKPTTPELVARRVAFGARLRVLRRERGISQEQLAYLADLDRSYVGAVERGERNLGLDNVGRLADALDVQMRDLFDL